MIEPSRNIALMLFLRNEKQEALAKPLATGQRVNRAIFHKLNQHTRRQARLSGLPLLVVQGRRQSGDTFGERLANAFEYAFAQGFDGVIAIGNDCLALDAARLREAAFHLTQSEAVFGPAKDGGVYLLGLSRRAYHRSYFLKLPWQTGELFPSLLGYARQWSHSPFLLREEEDADDTLAIQRLIGLLSFNSGLRRALESLLAPDVLPLQPTKEILPDGPPLTCLQRGPPPRPFQTVASF